MNREGVKMTIQDISVLYAKLNEVVKEKKVFAGEVNLAIAKNMLGLESELKDYEKSRESLVDRFVVKDEQGKPQSKREEYVFEADEDKEAYIAAVQELMRTEVELEVHKVEYKLLEGEEHDVPTAADLVAMDFMLDF